MSAESSQYVTEYNRGYEEGLRRGRASVIEDIVNDMRSLSIYKSRNISHDLTVNCFDCRDVMRILEKYYKIN